MAQHEIELTAYPVVFAEPPVEGGFQDVYGGAGELVVLESYRYTPANHGSDTVIVFMHPIGGGVYLPMVRALARAGHHVIYCNSRYRGVDSALIMEKVVLDLGACIRDAVDRLGYRNVVLGGWSGGGSLSMFYQQQAEQPTITETPAGDPVNLPGAELIPAVAVLQLAAHISRHGTLTEWMDPSLTDESDPTAKDPGLDLYDPANPAQPPYDQAFLDRFAAAQIARNRRITAWVKEQLHQLRTDGQPSAERAFVVHGTMADPRWLDPTIDPSDRTPGVCYLGDPAVVNHSPIGLARFASLRSWLSQWSYDDARGDSITAGRRTTVPVLVVSNSADNACTPSHSQRMYEAITHPDKSLHVVQGANHYYLGPDQAPMLEEAVTTVSSWLTQRGWA